MGRFEGQENYTFFKDLTKASKKILKAEDKLKPGVIAKEKAKKHIAEKKILEAKAAERHEYLKKKYLSR